MKKRMSQTLSSLIEPAVDQSRDEEDEFAFAGNLMNWSAGGAPEFDDEETEGDIDDGEFDTLDNFRR